MKPQIPAIIRFFHACREISRALDLSRPVDSLLAQWDRWRARRATRREDLRMEAYHANRQQRTH